MTLAFKCYSKHLLLVSVGSKHLCSTDTCSTFLNGVHHVAVLVVMQISPTVFGKEAVSCKESR